MNNDTLIKQGISGLAGIIPAAGSASRISPIPCSKEIFPIGFEENFEEPRIRVAASCLLEGFYEAGADQIYIVIRKGKWDIPEYFGTGSKSGSPLAYIVTDPTPGTHYTVDLAYSFVHDKMILFGFPDIQFKPRNAFSTLLSKQKKTGADVVLGLFKATNPLGADMVDIDDQSRLKKIIIKPSKTKLQYTWIIAVWTPLFSNYIHDYISGTDIAGESHEKKREKKEIYIGDVIQDALENGLNIETVLFKEGEYIDIGTIPHLRKAVIGGL